MVAPEHYHYVVSSRIYGNSNNNKLLYKYRASQELHMYEMHAFLCFIVVSNEWFSHILQGYFKGTGAIMILPQCQLSIQSQ